MSTIMKLVPSQAMVRIVWASASPVVQSQRWRRTFVSSIFASFRLGSRRSASLKASCASS